MTEAYDDLKRGERGAWISIAAYVVLSIVKLAIGYLFHSEALLADGLNNSTDIVASIAVIVGLRISRKPPDEDHPYGHFRAETLAALVASFIMMAVGIQVLVQAVQKLIYGGSEVPNALAAWVALACALVMYGVYRSNLRLARQINSGALRATAKDNLSDALVSVGAFVGIIGSQFGLPWLDVLTAFVVGLIICKTAWDIFRDTSLSLTDGFDEDKLEEFKATIGSAPGVERLKDIRARQHGAQVLVDATVLVDNNLSVSESHEITERIERMMLETYRIEHVHIHIEPVRGKNRLKEKPL